MKKKFALLLACVLSVSSVQATAFSDINGHWAETVINELASQGIISGFGDDSFKPNGAVTRAEYLKMIMNAMGIMPVECDSETYMDAAKDDWYSGYLKSAMDKGLIPHEMITDFGSEIISEENSDGKVISAKVKYSGAFNGGISITREEMAFLTMSMYQYMLNAKTMQALAEKTDITFTDDANISEWALTGVRLAAANGLIEGMDDGSFQPNSTTTRAQSATVISRVLEKLK